MSGLSPQQARIKQAVIEAVEVCGGVDGAAALVDKSRSLAGSWRNINQTDLPRVDDATKLDSVAVAQGREPPVTSAMARELGGVFLPLPAADPCDAALPGHVMHLTTELGDLSRRVGEALADGKVCRNDAAKIEREINDLIAVAVRARAHVQQLQERG